MGNRFGPSNHRSSKIEPGHQFVQNAETSAGVLEEIAVECGFKVVWM